MAALGIFGTSLVYRVALVALWPACYGGDALGRLEHAREPLWSPVQLPLTGVVVWLFAKLSWQPMAQRIGFSILGSLACVALGASVARLGGRRAGILAATVLSLCPVYVQWSVVPYGEALMIGTLLPGLTLFYLGEGIAEQALGMALFAVATTARYEAWLVLPLLLVFRPARRGPTLLLLPIPAIFPALWMLHAGGVSPIGLRSLDLRPAWDRTYGLLYPIGGAAFLMTPPLFLFAASGVFHALSSGKHDLAALAPERRRFLVLLLCCGAVFALFVAAAHPYATVDNPRQAIFPCAILAVFAGLEIHRAERMLPRVLYPYPRPRPTILAAALLLLFAWPLLQGAWRVRRSALEVDPRIGEGLGAFLREHLGPEDVAAVVAKPREDFPTLAPTVTRWTRVDSGPPEAASRIRSVAPGGDKDRARFVAVIAPVAESPAAFQEIPSPDRSVRLFERVP